MIGIAKPLSDYMYFYLGARLHGRPDLGEQLVTWEQRVADQIGESAAAIALFAELEAVVISSPIPDAIRRNICTKPENRQQLCQLFQAWCIHRQRQLARQACPLVRFLL